MFEEKNKSPSEGPDGAAFHQGLHCLPRQNRSPEKQIQYPSVNYNL